MIRSHRNEYKSVYVIPERSVILAPAQGAIKIENEVALRRLTVKNQVYNKAHCQFGGEPYLFAHP